jgi:hypothetical protein
VGGDLEELPVAPAADGAEAGALGPHVVGPAAHQALDLVGPGVGGEVEVRLGRAPAGREEGVAHRTAHQIQGAPAPVNRSASSAVA